MKRKLTKKEELAKLESLFISNNNKAIRKLEKQSGIKIINHDNRQAI